jgi:hypothetical protein
VWRSASGDPLDVINHVEDVSGDDLPLGRMRIVEVSDATGESVRHLKELGVALDVDFGGGLLCHFGSLVARSAAR